MGIYRFVIVLLICLLIDSLFLTIEWFTVWAWIGLSFLFAILYDCFYVTQMNNEEIAEAVVDRLHKIENVCTQMSTMLNEISGKNGSKKR